MRCGCPGLGRSYVEVELDALFDNTAGKFLNRVLGEFVDDLLGDLLACVWLVNLVGMLNNVVSVWILNDSVQIFDYVEHEYPLHGLYPVDFLHKRFYLS